jgi:hypothetical protein
MGHDRHRPPSAHTGNDYNFDLRAALGTRRSPSERIGTVGAGGGSRYETRGE